MTDITKCASEECMMENKCIRKTEKTGENQSFCLFKHHSKLEEEKCKWFLGPKVETSR